MEAGQVQQRASDGLGRGTAGVTEGATQEDTALPEIEAVLTDVASNSITPARVRGSAGNWRRFEGSWTAGGMSTPLSLASGTGHLPPLLPQVIRRRAPW